MFPCPPPVGGGGLVPVHGRVVVHLASHLGLLVEPCHNILLPHGLLLPHALLLRTHALLLHTHALLLAHILLQLNPILQRLLAQVLLPILLLQEPDMGLLPPSHQILTPIISWCC